MSGKAASFFTSDIMKETIIPTAVGVGGAVLASELQGKPKAPKVQQQKQEPLPPIIFEAPSLPSLPTPPKPQVEGGRTQEETKAMKAERKRLRQASGRASTILVGMDDEDEEDALRGKVKKKSLLGGLN